MYVPSMADSMLSLQNLMEATRSSAFIMSNPPWLPSIVWPRKRQLFPIRPSHASRLRGPTNPWPWPTTRRAFRTPPRTESRTFSAGPENCNAAAAAGFLTSVSRFGSPFSAAANMYLSRLGKPITDLHVPTTGPAALYWPANLLHSPAAWRDPRLPCPPGKSITS